MKKTVTPLKAIRAKCLDCCCGDARYVKECHIRTCPLWPYRMGRGYQDPSKPAVSGQTEPDTVEASRQLAEMVENGCFTEGGGNDLNNINQLEGLNLDPVKSRRTSTLTA
jgi:hypothetical protein